MRYPQGGGLTAERRAFREPIRMQAGELFTLGHDDAAIARQLRVSVRSVQQRWHQAWERGGTPGLESKGQAPRPRYAGADARFARGGPSALPLAVAVGQPVLEVGQGDGALPA
ncbi:helix-turn-helix domain-containing protein [Streptomyces avermitilis]|uniref:helix-turn-helix domain-containing protein n=1 Tax=Streptomyces avermitilis TaxID=33903 RepID=UPI00369A929B